jgi:hypothetical protein
MVRICTEYPDLESSLFGDDLVRLRQEPDEEEDDEEEDDRKKEEDDDDEDEGDGYSE